MWKMEQLPTGSWNDYATHIHGLADQVKKGFSFARDLSLENSNQSCLCFQSTSLHTVSYFITLSITVLFFAYTFLYCFIKRFSVDPSLNYFVFGDFSVHHKNWLICVSETYTSLTMFFLLSTFLLGSVYSTAHSPAR